MHACVPAFVSCVALPYGIFQRATAERAICYRPSVRLSVTWLGQSESVAVIIMQFSPYSNPILLVFARQVSSRNSNWFPWSGRHKQRWGGGKQATFLALFINISKTVRDNVYSYYVDVVGLSSAMGLQSQYRARAKWRFSTSIRENISQTVSIGLNNTAMVRYYYISHQ